VLRCVNTRFSRRGAEVTELVAITWFSLYLIVIRRVKKCYCVCVLMFLWSLNSCLVRSPSWKGCILTFFWLEELYSYVLLVGRVAFLRFSGWKGSIRTFSELKASPTLDYKAAKCDYRHGPDRSRSSPRFEPNTCYNAELSCAMVQHTRTPIGRIS
jgi:hypothetical protein